MGDRQPLNRLVVLDEVREAEVGKRGHGEVDRARQGGLVIERSGKLLADLGEECGAPFSRLRRRAGLPLASQ